MVLEYKLYEPAFYHTDVQDWGQSLSVCQHLGERAQVCVDTGHHAMAVNIEQIVAILLQEGRLGAFDLNDKKYGDDDLMVGSIDPYQLFRIFHELVGAMRDESDAVARDTANRVVYMLDQCHNIEPKIPAMIRSVMTLQETFARALLVDTRGAARGPGARRRPRGEPPAPGRVPDRRPADARGAASRSAGLPGRSVPRLSRERRSRSAGGRAAWAASRRVGDDGQPPGDDLAPGLRTAARPHPPRRGRSGSGRPLPAVTSLPPMRREAGSRYFEGDSAVAIFVAHHYPTIGWHEHDFYELAVVSTGRGLHESEHGIIPVEAGTVVFIPPGVSHEYRGCEDLIVYNCLFRADLDEAELMWAFRDGHLSVLFNPDGLSSAGSRRPPVAVQLDDEGLAGRPRGARADPDEHAPMRGRGPASWHTCCLPSTSSRPRRARPARGPWAQRRRPGRGRGSADADGARHRLPLDARRS